MLLPGVEGYFGVKANHVPTIAQLKPGVVELHDGAEVSKYFVSGGFAFVHPNATADICVLEAATLDQFDSTAVKSALQVRGVVWRVSVATRRDASTSSCEGSTGLELTVPTPCLCVSTTAHTQAAQASAATDDYEAAVNRTAQELYSALDAAMESKG